MGTASPCRSLELRASASIQTEAVRALHRGTCLVLALPSSSRKNSDNGSSALICKKKVKAGGACGNESQ